MKFLLVGINAKYIHSNLAIRSLKTYTEEQTALKIQIAEYTINQHPDELLREIYLQKPDFVGFSCYIWNIELIQVLVRELKQLLPNCLFLLGGPEVSYSPEESLLVTQADMILISEGEESFRQLAEAAAQGRDIYTAAGLAYLEGKNLIVNPPPPPISMDSLPFPYSGEDQKSLFLNHILYYECSRGCPFSCAYCLSGHGSRVRFRSLSLVFRDLDYFLEQNVPQVKFVDRTFNWNREYASAIFHYLAEHDNQVTNFHFEIAAELLDQETINWLNHVRPGLFQFEIGVQSTNPDTLKAIQRITLPEKLTPIVKSLQKGKNIHLHLDLIAGLPFENYNRFGVSFDYVYSLAPDQLQLGFLKLLKGSRLYEDREKYQLYCQKRAPYEVTGTPCLSFDEILRLKMLAEMVELYYNSGRYGLELSYLLSFFERPFLLFEALGDWYAANGYHLAPHAKLAYYTILKDFFLSLGAGNFTRFQTYARFDLLASEKPKTLPEWLEKGAEYKNEIYHWLDNEDNRRKYLSEYENLQTRQLLRAVSIAAFPFHPVTGEERPCFLLFRYRTKRGEAKVIEIEL